jgi:hypothetical protein
LAKIGFTRQKMRGKHYRKDAEATRQWREEMLPKLKKKAALEGYLFIYIDEASARAFKFTRIYLRTDGSSARDTNQFGDHR